MPSRVPQTRTSDRDETGQDDFEQRMAGVSRLPGRGRLVEETVVRARQRATVRERSPGVKPAGAVGSPGTGPRLKIGPVAGLNRRQVAALRPRHHRAGKARSAGRGAWRVARGTRTVVERARNPPARAGMRARSAQTRGPGGILRAAAPASQCGFRAFIVPPGSIRLSAR